LVLLTFVVSNEVRDAIFESEVGPRILYHLAENPEIAEQLQGMTLTKALGNNWETGSAV